MLFRSLRLLSSAPCRRRPLSSNVRRRKTHSLGALRYHMAMTVAVGTVREGKVVLEGIALPDGSVVTVLADDDRPPFRLPPHIEAELQAAIDEADCEEGGAGPEFLEELKRYG